MPARISIHAPHAGSDTSLLMRLDTEDWISIHAPHAGSDVRVVKGKPVFYISIHAPHAGSDRRGERRSACRSDFNPRSPCGERQVPTCRKPFCSRFQSTLPMRGATLVGYVTGVWEKISIHAPHAGSDIQNISTLVPTYYFNPRSPCGERLDGRKTVTRLVVFQSTLPMRGATSAKRRNYGTYQAFQSTLPMRGATTPLTTASTQSAFQSTLPMRGATNLDPAYITVYQIFQSTLPMRGATFICRIEAEEE